MAPSGTVHVVHCIDTEGPFHESVEAIFLSELKRGLAPSQRGGR